jgi:hypothetical protein
MKDFKIVLAHLSLEKRNIATAYLFSKCTPLKEKVHTDIATAHSAKCSCLEEETQQDIAIGYTENVAI